MTEISILMSVLKSCCCAELDAVIMMSFYRILADRVIAFSGRFSNWTYQETRHIMENACKLKLVPHMKKRL